MNVARIGVSLMTYSYQQDNKGKTEEFGADAWDPLEKFFIFMLFSTKKHTKYMKRVLEKTMPLFDFLQHTTLNKLSVMRKLFEELDEEAKLKNLSLNQNIVK